MHSRNVKRSRREVSCPKSVTQVNVEVSQSGGSLGWQREEFKTILRLYSKTLFLENQIKIVGFFLV